MDGGSPRCHTTAGEPPPIVCPAPQSWAHSTHPAGTDDQQGGSPKGVRCVFLVPSGPGDSGRGCSEYPNSGLRSGFLFVPSRTRVQNLRRISSPSVSDGTRVLMRKNVQSNHRTYSVNVWIKVGRECRDRPPGIAAPTCSGLAGLSLGVRISCRVFPGIVPGCCLAAGNSTTGPGDGSADSLLSGCLSWSEECQLLAVHRSFRLRPEGRGRSFRVSWCTWFRRRILRWR